MSLKLPQKLGELETQIMEILWDCPDCSVRSVLEKLQKKRKLAYTTIMTVMSRLCEKGLLKRKSDENGAYLYQPVVNKQEYQVIASKMSIQALLKQYGDVAIAQFIDVVQSASPKQVGDWREVLKKIK